MDRPSAQSSALWVLSAGAGLLVVAASLFVAVNWDRISETMKLAVVVATTLAAALGGWRVRLRLPLTAAVLGHFAAALVAVDVAAVLILDGAPSVWTTAATASATAVAFGALSRLSGSWISHVVTALAVPVAAVAFAHVVGDGDLVRHSVTFGLGVLPAAVLAAATSRRARVAGLASAGIGALLSLIVAVDTPTVIGVGLMSIGAVVAAWAVAVGPRWLAWVATGPAVLGWWVALADLDVGGTTPYLWPLGAIAVVAGLRLFDEADGSWLRFGPGVAVLVASPLVDRIPHGDGLDAVVAGTIALAATAAGASWRHAAPLLIGTVGLTVLVVHESLAVSASVPTWAWFAGAGAVLFSLGLWLERRGIGPVESGRRLVQRFDERFA